MDKEFSLSDLFVIVRSKLKWIILVSVLFLILSFVFSSFFITKTYTSNAKMIASFTTLDKEVDKIPNQVTTTQTGAAIALAESYSEILKSDYSANLIYEKIVDLNWKNISVGLIKSSISIKSSETSSVMNFYITTSNPELSRDICKALVDIAPEVIYKKFYGSIHPLDDPTLPTAPSSPNVLRNSVLGALLGAVISIAIFVFLHFLDNKIISEKDICKKYELPFLGNIPSFDNTKLKKVNGESKDSNAISNFFIVESYKNLRTNLMYTFNNGNIVAFTSAEAGAGKSVTCSNLAVAFAEAGLKVLVIDADMRKATQHKIFKIPNDAGLSKFLSGQCDLQSATTKTSTPNLDVITAGPTPPNPSELLSFSTIDDLFSAASKTYDYVFIDTPPINYVTDCLTFVSKINGLIMVARSKHTEQSEFAKAVESAKAVGAKIVGLVLGDVAADRSEKYYRKRYYYNGK